MKASAPDRMPAWIASEIQGDIAIVRLARPEKRNALNDPVVRAIEEFFARLPESVKAVVLHGEGPHFCAGLDVSELKERSVAEAVAHSQNWHRVFDKIQFGRAPVVTVMQGAVVGGGLEFASATHLRVAERSAFYALPEGSFGIFVGGGGSVRLPRLIGTARVTDMILTGRTYNAEEGQALGISHYLVDDGQGLAKGVEIARRIAKNAPLTNFAVLQALPRIAESNPAAGFLTEALVASIAQGEEEAKARLKAFLEKRAARVVKN